MLRILLDSAQARLRVQVKVLGYFIWSIYDNWEWAAGMGWKPSSICAVVQQLEHVRNGEQWSCRHEQPLRLDLRGLSNIAKVPKGVGRLDLALVPTVGAEAALIVVTPQSC